MEVPEINKLVQDICKTRTKAKLDSCKQFYKEDCDEATVLNKLKIKDNSIIEEAILKIEKILEIKKLI